MEAQKRMRIKVNKVAIHQTLKVEHIMEYLKENGIFSDKDEETILAAGSHPFDRAKVFVQLLLNNHHTKSDWYFHFRESLKTPNVENTEIRKKYQILVEFLDNTIISMPRPPTQPKAKLRMPHYDPLPSIGPDSETPGSKGFGSRVGSRVTFNIGMTPDEEAETIIVKGSESVQDKMSHFGEVEKGSFEGNPPENKDKIDEYLEEQIRRAGILTVPKERLKALKLSGDPEYQKQFEAEMAVLENMKGLLDIYMQARDGNLPENTIFFREPPVMKVLDDELHHHLYYKYLNPLLTFHRLNIFSGIVGSFISYVGQLEVLDNDTERGELVYNAFQLSEFLHGFGLFYQAEQVLFCLLLYLQTNPVMESWIGQWEAYIKVMSIRNTNLNFTGADEALRAASIMATRIKLMSFGKDILDEVDMFVELSYLMREQGSYGPAMSWAQSALKEVEADNHEGIIRALCAAVRGYLGKGNFKRAQQCAVQAVQQANSLFGSFHPLYIEALLNYCFMSTTVGGTKNGAAIAKKTLVAAQKAYGGDSLQVAAAHQSITMAMLAEGTKETAEALSHAREGYYMIKDLVRGDHPRIAPFQVTLAKALLAHACYPEGQQDRLGLLLTARINLKAAVGTFNSAWGMFSTHYSTGLLVSGQVEQALGEMDKAEEFYKEGLKLLELTVSRKSYILAQAKVQIASSTFQAQSHDNRVLALLEGVIQNKDTAWTSVPWISRAYELLGEVYHAKSEPQEAEKYRHWIREWLQATHPLEEVTWEQLHAMPDKYDQFMEKFDIWKARLVPQGKRSLVRSLKMSFKTSL